MSKDVDLNKMKVSSKRQARGSKRNGEIGARERERDRVVQGAREREREIQGEREREIQGERERQ